MNNTYIQFPMASQMHKQYIYILPKYHKQVLRKAITFGFQKMKKIWLPKKKYKNYETINHVYLMSKNYTFFFRWYYICLWVSATKMKRFCDERVKNSNQFYAFKLDMLAKHMYSGYWTKRRNEKCSIYFMPELIMD